MAATPPDVERLRRRFQFPAAEGEHLFLSQLYSDGQRPLSFSLVGPFIGAPQAAMLMETLAAWGARRIIFFGWCGALAPSVQSGDVVVPCGAFVDEGTSRGYGCDTDRVRPFSSALQSELNAQLSRDGIVCQEGWVWSTDAVFRETERKVCHYQTLGALVVEMELSVLYTVGRHLGIELAAVLVVSDELSTLQWRPGFKTVLFKEARLAVCESIASFVERSAPC